MRKHILPLPTNPISSKRHLKTDFPIFPHLLPMEHRSGFHRQWDSVLRTLASLLLLWFTLIVLIGIIPSIHESSQRVPRVSLGCPSPTEKTLYSGSKCYQKGMVSYFCILRTDNKSISVVLILPHVWSNSCLSIWSHSLSLPVPQIRTYSKRVKGLIII